MVVLNIFGYLLLLASGLLMIQGVWALVISLDWNTRGRSFCVEKNKREAHNRTVPVCRIFPLRRVRELEKLVK